MANEQLEQYNNATRTRAGCIVKLTKNSGFVYYRCKYRRLFN